MTKITGYVVQERKSHTGGWKTISPKFGRSETARRWMKDHYRYEYHWFRVEPRRSAA